VVVVAAAAGQLTKVVETLAWFNCLVSCLILKLYI